MSHALRSLCLLCLLLSHPAFLQGQTDVAKRATAPIVPEPLSLGAGKPLSIRTLVQKPPALKDVASWTIETRRHRGYIVTSAVSGDGTRVATGGLDGIVRIWDAKTGEFVRALVGHDSYVYGLDWSPDGKHLASAGSFDATVRLWDVSTGMALRVLKGHKGYVYRVAWSPDARSVVAAGGSSGFITLWDVDKPRSPRTAETGNAITGLAWGPDSKQLAVAGVMIGVRIYDIREGTATRDLEVPGKTPTAVVWSSDGKKLAASGGSKMLVWEAATGKKLHELDGTAVALAFAADGKTLAASGGGKVYVWEGGALDKKALEIPESALALGFSPEGELLATTANQVSRWQVTGAKQIQRIDAAGGTSTQYASGRPLISGIGESAITLWNTSTGKRIARLDHPGGVTAAAWSGDGKTLATACTDKQVRLWTDGKLTRTLTGHEGSVTCVAWGDGKSLASGSLDKTVRLWQASGDKGKIAWTHTDVVRAVAWAKSGKQLASGGDETKVYIGPAEGGKPTRIIQVAEPTRTLAWSPTAKFLAAGGTTGGIQLFSPATGKLQQELPTSGSPPNITSLAWSADGATLLAGRANHTTEVVRAGSPKVLLTLPGMGPTTAVSWSSAGNMIASEANRSVRSFDLIGGKEAALRATMVVEAEQLVTVSTLGHYKTSDEGEGELIAVVQSARAQDTLSLKEFSAKHRHKNNSALARMSSK